ncbi:MAG: hypothetical protein ACFFCQ_11550 [Promethearchaeota archaeon]
MKRTLTVLLFLGFLIVCGMIAVIYDPWERPKEEKLNKADIEDLIRYKDVYEGLNVSFIASIKGKIITNTFTLLDLTDGKQSLIGNFSDEFKPSIDANVAFQGISFLESRGYVQIIKIHQIHEKYAIFFSLIGLGVLGVPFSFYYRFDFKKGFCWKR